MKKSPHRIRAINQKCCTVFAVQALVAVVPPLNFFIFSKLQAITVILFFQLIKKLRLHTISIMIIVIALKR